MKPTFIALLALCLFLVGCATTPKGINQTSKVAIGTPIWEFEMGSYVWSSPAIGSDGTVYVGSYKKLYAINGKSGCRSRMIVKLVCRSLFVIFDRLPFSFTPCVLGFSVFPNV